MSSSFSSLWLRWKSLRLPWRRKFLVGADLQGNTYWEFKNNLSGDPTRMRRIVQASRKTHHSDVQVSPQWHQWLRHTRNPPPSLEEQQMDVLRQIQLKENARLADARWAGKKRYIEAAPKKQQQEQQGQVEGTRMTMGGNQEDVGGTGQTIAAGDAPKTEPGREQPDPWEAERQRQQSGTSSSGGGWQPEAWTPPPRARKT